VKRMIQQDSQPLSELTVIVRGAGDLATGTACRLYRSGFHKLLMTEVEQPLAVRRMVSFCEAIYEGRWTVEGITAIRISSAADAFDAWREGLIPVIVDPQNGAKDSLKPKVIVDAILAKHNLGTKQADAPLVIALGPGFSAGDDVDCVVETNRGHDLGRLILQGPAAPDTGIPGDIGGQSVRRVIRAPGDGVFESQLEIGTKVLEGQAVGQVNGLPVTVTLSGVLRGLIRPGLEVSRGLKIGDVDPRGDVAHCSTISEKARAIGGAVLEAILMRFNAPCCSPGTASCR
jgi:xanthine dehydrogenase accessory factor